MTNFVFDLMLVGAGFVGGVLTSIAFRFLNRPKFGQSGAGTTTPVPPRGPNGDPRPTETKVRFS
jgi:hypothetical protein